MRVHFLPNSFSFNEHIFLWKRAVRKEQTLPWKLAFQHLKKGRHVATASN